MKQNLFEKAIIFGDLHFGNKNNDRQFNLDCENYIIWLIELVKSEKADCVIFLGDWHHNRNSIHISTLNYSLSNLERLDSIGIPVYFIPGNHDEYFKEKRELSSISIARNMNNIHIFEEITFIGNVTFCPWLVSDEWKEIPKLAKKSSYIFGHFELPKFQMNAMVEMPDHGGLNYEHFNDVEFLALTGHFHKRQSKGKVLYIGNAFPHSYSDVWDDDRGAVVLKWGSQPEFHKWIDAPNYRTMLLSELLDSFEDSLNERSYSRITIDLDLHYNETQFIKDIFQAHCNTRKLDMLPYSRQQEEYNINSNIEFQSVDQIVIEGLKNIDSISMDKNILIDIFNSLN